VDCGLTDQRPVGAQNAVKPSALNGKNPTKRFFVDERVAAPGGTTSGLARPSE